MKHAELIERLGGNAALAYKLKRDQTSVSRWKQRGIPASLWPKMAALAVAQGIKITAQQIADEHPQFGRQRQSRGTLRRTKLTGRDREHPAGSGGGGETTCVAARHGALP